MDPEVAKVKEDLQELRNEYVEHDHNGNETALVNFLDISGKIGTVDAVPTATPRNLQEQIRIYVNGATLRLYVYDTVNNAWRYATLT